jgi:chromate transporter
MAAVTWYLGRAAIVDVPTALLAIASTAVLLRYKLNSIWLVLAGAIAGVIYWLAG